MSYFRIFFIKSITLPSSTWIIQKKSWFLTRRCTILKSARQAILKFLFKGNDRKFINDFFEIESEHLNPIENKVDLVEQKIVFQTVDALHIKDLTEFIRSSNYINRILSTIVIFLIWFAFFSLSMMVIIIISKAESRLAGNLKTVCCQASFD